MTPKAIRISVGARTLLALFVLGLLLSAVSAGWDLQQDVKRRSQQLVQDLDAIPLIYASPLLHSQGQSQEAMQSLLTTILRQHELRSIELLTRSGEQIRAESGEVGEPGPSAEFALSGGGGALKVQAQRLTLMQMLQHDALLRSALGHLLFVVLLGLLAAVLLDRWLLRQLRRLSDEAHRFEATMPPQSLSWLEPEDHGPQEVLELERAFAHVHSTLGGELQREQTRGRQLRDEMVRQHQRLAEVERSLEAKRRELAALERHDALTGACNRREFEVALRREFKRVQRDQGRLAIAVLDVDHLRLYNERHGRAAGDALLKRLADLLAEQFQRDTDVVARLGGEEFVVLMPGLDIRLAQERMETVRDALRALALSHGALPDSNAAGLHQDWVTVSIGVAAYQPGRPYLSSQSMLQAADEALYLAKHTGRDRICLAS
ncbi:GGDEF domain-containing protein [Roseateles depolymerans]|uniref:diguanylate cyclase n=1 Tax=Roseateles depolymerans TaxID=76731 RepID=A0A0U3LMA3_9BURK|nr:GGDEF domain-containing protein [Roseateles depolymerans]ALV09247.1 diguanylate cyclase [Roseateles depolymerans]REG14005.1 diguanylate cyclase (GGDEF)-like protein [Roseateles depolymerans]